MRIHAIMASMIWLGESSFDHGPVLRRGVTIVSRPESMPKRGVKLVGSSDPIPIKGAISDPIPIIGRSAAIPIPSKERPDSDMSQQLPTFRAPSGLQRNMDTHNLLGSLIEGLKVASNVQNLESKYSNARRTLKKQNERESHNLQRDMNENGRESMFRRTDLEAVDDKYTKAMASLDDAYRAKLQQLGGH